MESSRDNDLRRKHADDVHDDQSARYFRASSGTPTTAREISLLAIKSRYRRSPFPSEINFYELERTEEVKGEAGHI